MTSEHDPRDTKKKIMFVSHRGEDYQLAKDIISQLREYLPQVDFFMSEDINKGGHWRDAIAQAINGASWFLLIYTDPAANWQWCFYEAGLFDCRIESARKVLNPLSDQPQRLYCLHHEKVSQPNALSHLQSIAARRQDLARWLSKFIPEAGGSVSEKTVDEISARVAATFSYREEFFSCDKFTIIIPRPEGITPGHLPDDSLVTGTPHVLANLFDLVGSSFEWGLLRESINSSSSQLYFDGKWLNEISCIIHNTLKRKNTRPLQSTIFSKTSEFRYRPVLNTVAKHRDNSLHCEFLVIEEVGGYVKNMGFSAAALVTSLRVGVRMRYDVIKPYLDEIAAKARFETPRKLREDLRTVLINIKTEADARGVVTRDYLRQAFTAPEHRALLDEMFLQWHDVEEAIWTGIGLPAADRPWGELPERPLTAEEIAALEGALHTIDEHSRAFLNVAAPRLLEIID